MNLSATKLLTVMHYHEHKTFSLKLGVGWNIALLASPVSRNSVYLVSAFLVHLTAFLFCLSSHMKWRVLWTVNQTCACDLMIFASHWCDIHGQQGVKIWHKWFHALRVSYDIPCKMRVLEGGWGMHDLLHKFCLLMHSYVEHGSQNAHFS